MATIDDARQLSSGTISTLIHRSDYAAIERTQTAFVAFVARMDQRAKELLNQPQCFATWQEAWDAFRKTDDWYKAVSGT